MVPDLPLRQWQREAWEAVLAHYKAGKKAALVHACTGAGKSRLIARFVGAAKGTVLITTPTQALVDQLWAQMPDAGRAYQHAWEPGRKVVVACHASLPRLLAERNEWGLWVADEAHTLEGDALRTAREALRYSYALGLTATPFRSDDKGLKIWDDLIYSYSSYRAVADGVLCPWRVVRWDGQGTDDTDEIVRRWVLSADGPGIVSAMDIADAERFAATVEGAVPVHSGLSSEQVRYRMRALKSGSLRCVVHVSMLAVGVDYPWLRWLVLRRPVSSPVRLVQEVGRVLRSAPGKTHATIYDPHDLLASIGLVHAAQLEDVLAPRKAAEEEPWSIPELEPLGSQFVDLPKAVAVSRLEAWAADYVAELRGAGKIPPPAYQEGPWRRKRASAKQIAATQKMAGLTRRLTPTQASAVGVLLKDPALRSGTAADILSILIACSKKQYAALEP